MYVDKLGDIANKYNYTYHRIIKRKPVDVSPNMYTETNKDNINPIAHGGIYPACRIFFNNFFFTEAKSLKISDFKFLSFRHNVAKFH